MADPKIHATTDPFACSFCGKARREVGKMMSGPKVFICDECVKLCVDILAEDKSLSPEKHEWVDFAAQLEAERKAHEETRAELRETRHAIIAIVDELNHLPFVEKSTRCSWCGQTFPCAPEGSAVREHVASCEHHPAVIRLREVEAAAAAQAAPRRKKVTRG